MYRSGTVDYLYITVIYDRIKKDLTDLHSFGAMMSGSGPSVFGLFENAKMAKEAAGILRSKYPKAEFFVTSFIQPK